MADPRCFETEAEHLASGLGALSQLVGQCEQFPNGDDMYSLLELFVAQARRVQDIGMGIAFPERNQG